MKKSTVWIMTLIMMVLSFLFTIAMAVFAIMAALIVRAIPPVVVLLLVFIGFLWISAFYWNCYGWLGGKSFEARAIQRLKKQNIVLMVIMLVITFSMGCAFIWMLGFFRSVYTWVQLYFGGVALVAISYTVNMVLLQKQMQKETE